MLFDIRSGRKVGLSFVARENRLCLFPGDQFAVIVLRQFLSAMSVPLVINYFPGAKRWSWRKFECAVSLAFFYLATLQRLRLIWMP